MSLICSICGSSDVGCHALVNPNNTDIINFSEDSYEDAYCMFCDNYTVLFEPQKVKCSIRGDYYSYVMTNNREPHFALCDIVWKDSRTSQRVKIAMPEGNRPDMDSEIFFSCGNLEELLALVDPGREDFVLLNCAEFDIWDDVNIYEFEIDGQEVSVTERDVRNFYGKHYPLSHEEIERYAARYVAKRRVLAMCDQWLDSKFIRQMLEQNATTAKGTKVSFKINCYSTWYVEILWELEDNYAPYKYSLKAYCLNSPQGGGRRFTSLEEAILHCLNDFNENASIPNMYNSMEEFWANSALYEKRLNSIRNK